MNTLTNSRGKSYKSHGTSRSQDDVMSSAKPYSTWQGKVFTFAMILVAAGLIHFVGGLIH